MSYLSISLLFDLEDTNKILNFRKAIQKKSKHKSHYFKDEIPHVNLISGKINNKLNLEKISRIIKSYFNSKISMNFDGTFFLIKNDKVIILLRFRNFEKLFRFREILFQREIYEKVDTYSDRYNWIPKSTIENIPHKNLNQTKFNLFNFSKKNFYLNKKIYFKKIAIIKYYPSSNKKKLDEILHIVNL